MLTVATIRPTMRSRAIAAIYAGKFQVSYDYAQW